MSGAWRCWRSAPAIARASSARPRRPALLARAAEPRKSLSLSTRPAPLDGQCRPGRWRHGGSAARSARCSRPGSRMAWRSHRSTPAARSHRTPPAPAAQWQTARYLPQHGTARRPEQQVAMDRLRRRLGQAVDRLRPDTRQRQVADLDDGGHGLREAPQLRRPPRGTAF